MRNSRLRKGILRIPDSHILHVSARNDVITLVVGSSANIDCFKNRNTDCGFSKLLRFKPGVRYSEYPKMTDNARDIAVMLWLGYIASAYKVK